MILEYHNYAHLIREQYFKILLLVIPVPGTIIIQSVLQAALKELNLHTILGVRSLEQHYARISGNGYDFYINLDPQRYKREQRSQKLKRILYER